MDTLSNLTRVFLMCLGIHKGLLKTEHRAVCCVGKEVNIQCLQGSVITDISSREDSRFVDGKKRKSFPDFGLHHDCTGKQSCRLTDLSKLSKQQWTLEFLKFFNETCKLSKHYNDGKYIFGEVEIFHDKKEETKIKDCHDSQGCNMVEDDKILNANYQREFFLNHDCCSGFKTAFKKCHKMKDKHVNVQYKMDECLKTIQFVNIYFVCDESHTVVTKDNTGEAIYITADSTTIINTETKPDTRNILLMVLLATTVVFSTALLFIYMRHKGFCRQQIYEDYRPNNEEVHDYEHIRNYELIPIDQNIENETAAQAEYVEPNAYFEVPDDAGNVKPDLHSNASEEVTGDAYNDTGYLNPISHHTDTDDDYDGAVSKHSPNN